MVQAGAAGACFVGLGTAWPKKEKGGGFGYGSVPKSRAQRSSVDASHLTAPRAIRGSLSNVDRTVRVAVAEYGIIQRPPRRCNVDRVILVSDLDEANRQLRELHAQLAVK